MKIIPIRFDDEMLKKLKKVSKELGLPLSTTIKFLLNEVLKRKK